MPAASYARFSTDEQNPLSIADQERVTAEYAARRGFPVTHRYADEGISGAAIGNRPGFQAMVASALRGEFDVLLVTDLSRLSRSAGDLNKTLDRLIFHGVRVIGVHSGYDSDRPGHKMQAGVEGMAGESFREMISKRVYEALSGRAARGSFAGGRAYGYRSLPIGPGEKSERRLEINEPEAVIVREIFQRFGGGESARAIAIALNRRGVPSPRGSTWAVSAIHGNRAKGCGILNNELYRGIYIWNRSHWVKHPDTGIRKRRELGRAKWLRHELPALRILSEELWSQVKRRQEKSRGGGRGRPAATLLGGLMRCGLCRAPVVAVDGRNYGCSHARDRGTCAGVYAPRLATERTVLDLIVQDMLSPAAIAALQTDRRAMLRERRVESQQGHQAAQARLTAVTREIGNLAASISRMGGSAALEARLAAAEAEQRALTAAIDAAPVTDDVIDEITDLVVQYRELLADLPNVLRTDTQRARGLLRELLGEVRLVQAPDGVYAEVDDYGEALKIPTDSTHTKVVAGGRFGHCKYRRRVA
jgi:DNA invertase Pin-like site-specific DNA recombinase